MLNNDNTPCLRIKRGRTVSSPAFSLRFSWTCMDDNDNDDDMDDTGEEERNGSSIPRKAS